jgi:ATP synthase protein I
VAGEGDAQDPLKDLGRRLEAARSSAAKPRQADAPPPMGNALAFAWRIGLELVVAILVGTGIGWALDRWVGTRPWGMIVMFFLGTAAGMLNVWRAVTGAGMAVGFRQQRGDAGAAKDDGEDED